jgi:hypothetical protein
LGTWGTYWEPAYWETWEAPPKLQFLCQDRVPAKDGRPWFFAIGLFKVLI